MADKGTLAAGQESQSMVRWLVETALLVLAAFILAQGIKTFIVQPFVIPTGSMIPTIEIGDRVIAEKISYRFRDPKAGEIVVFVDPTGQNPQLIKRVVATGGQTVDVKDGALWIDGKKMDEPYTHGQPTELGPGTLSFPMTVPEGKVLMMGDNRTNSEDGRYFGPQPIDAIKGRAVVTYWPISHWGVLQETPPQPAAQ